MSFWKALFGGSEENPEDEKVTAGTKKFDLLKYDGIKAMKMGQWDYALRCFEEALKLKDDLEIYDHMVRVLIRLDRLDDALAALEVLARAKPENTAVLEMMGQVAYMKEDYARMSEVCERSLAIAPDSATTYYQYAQAALGQGDLINGIARLTKAITLEEQYADARLLRAQTLMRMGDLNGAEEDSQWLTAHVGEQEDVLLLAARVAHAKGCDEEAIHIYNKVVDVNPFLLEAYQERGKIYYDQGKMKQAEEDMRKVLELNPQQMADVSGDYSAEGVEQQVKKAYSMMNPFGI